MDSGNTSTQNAIPVDVVKIILKSQYSAAFAMLRQVVECCPTNLWLSDAYTNQYWHIAYHAVFYTHLYAQVDEKAFQPWEKQRDNYQFMGSLPWEPYDKPDVGEPYSREDILEYLDFCESHIAGWVDKLDLNASECGFWWYKMSKLEHQFNNLRHIQHHAGQLADRLRNVLDLGSDWVGGKGE